MYVGSQKSEDTNNKNELSLKENKSATSLNPSNADELRYVQTITYFIAHFYQVRQSDAKSDQWIHSVGT